MRLVGHDGLVIAELKLVSFVLDDFLATTSESDEVTDERFAFQWDRVMRRQHVFDASLFGSLLPADAWDRVPEGRLPELLAAAPSFRPPRSK